MDASNELLRKAEPSALLYPDGIVRSLNRSMATALDRPAKRCVGRFLRELLPESQRNVVERIVAHAGKQRLAMQVLELPRQGRASVVALIEARPVTSAGGEQLVWVHSLNVSNDLGSLLIPFRLSARSAGLGLCMYLPQVRQIEWLGGAPAVAALFRRTRSPCPGWCVTSTPTIGLPCVGSCARTTAGVPGPPCGFKATRVTGTALPAKPVGSNSGTRVRADLRDDPRRHL
ncbi:PAS domain-containing protein [Streptomyces sp. T1317-0309]|nr:PAS domain-containing protein [Streptomyces sp. T1317-0309]